jgi:hypothetical protein
MSEPTFVQIGPLMFFCISVSVLSKLLTTSPNHHMIGTRFNQTCIVSVDTTACPTRVRNQFQAMCLFFAPVTAAVFIFTLVTVVRRRLQLNHQSMLFRITAPLLLVWAPMQFFYTLVHGISKNNFGTPSMIITLINLQSSMILGTTIPQIIITWSENYMRHKSLQGASYQCYYWLATISFNVLVAIVSLLAGVNVEYYNIAMRVLFGIWIAYLLICGVMLLFFGIKNYLILSHSIKASSSNNEGAVSAKTQILVILCFLCGGIFVIVIALFLYYSIDLKDIEASTSISLSIWICFKAGSIVYVLFWDIYFWINTDTLTKKQLDEDSSSNTTDTAAPASPRSPC